MREAASFIARQDSSIGAGLIPGLVEFVGRAFRTWKNRRAVETLTDFDDHMLADIGLTRDDVHRALDLPFAHDPGLELQRLSLGNRSRGWNV
jgi:uncharacterized protein YjiS (DUF1127 family)